MKLKIPDGAAPETTLFQPLMDKETKLSRFKPRGYPGAKFMAH